MTIWNYRLRPVIAGFLMLFLAAPFGAAIAQTQQTPGAQQTKTNPTPSQPQGSAAAAVNSPVDAPQAQTGSANSSSAPPQAGGSAQAQTSSSSAPPQQQKTPEPLGTAAAPYEKGTGVAASRPAGAVIAPAKQKRARSFVIKVAIIVGAAVAIGTVVGLSEASPSHPR
jgi:hypothetical protein